MLPGNLQTTAMGILPHRDVERALALTLSLDIPFWPQLPRLSYYEDMYAQASEHFPGVRLDLAQERVAFDTTRFYDELAAYAEASAEAATFALSPQYSAVYQRFLRLDLSRYPAIRGQIIGPLSFGLKISDENLKPIIYNDDVRTFIFDFIQRKLNHQAEELRAKHPGAFVWIDEPGLELLFSSFTGYTSERAKDDLAAMLAGVNGVRGVHLCGNPDWDFLLTADIDLLSFDAFGCGAIFTRYAAEIGRFLAKGRTIAWGLVPTAVEDFGGEGLETLLARIEGLWAYLVSKGVDRERLLHQALLAPARCCLLNPDKTETVEHAFTLLRQVSETLRQRYKL